MVFQTTGVTANATTVTAAIFGSTPVTFGSSVPLAFGILVRQLTGLQMAFLPKDTIVQLTRTVVVGAQATVNIITPLLSGSWVLPLRVENTGASDIALTSYISVNPDQPPVATWYLPDVAIARRRRRPSLVQPPVIQPRPSTPTNRTEAIISKARENFTPQALLAIQQAHTEF